MYIQISLNKTFYLDSNFGISYPIGKENLSKLVIACHSITSIVQLPWYQVPFEPKEN